VRGFLQAATAGDAVSIRTMLDNGLDPNTSDAKGRTALHIVSAKGLDHMGKLRSSKQNTEISDIVLLHPSQLRKRLCRIET